MKLRGLKTKSKPLGLLSSDERRLINIYVNIRVSRNAHMIVELKKHGVENMLTYVT